MAQSRISDLVNPINVNSSSIRAEWQRFKREFNCYLLINELDKKSDSIKLGHLTLIIGKDAADLVDELGLSDADKEDYKKVITGYENYFSP